MNKTCLISPSLSGGSRGESMFATQEEFEYAWAQILEKRRLEQLKAEHALANTSTTCPNSQTPTNQGKIKGDTAKDIHSVIKGVPFSSLIKAVEGNETQSSKNDVERDENHRMEDTAKQETHRSPGNERGTPQNEYGTMEHLPGATAPSIGLWAQRTLPPETRVAPPVAPPSDVANNDASAKAKVTYIKGLSMEILKKITESQNIKSTLTAGERLQLTIAVNGTEFELPVRLILGEQLTEDQCTELSSLLISIAMKLFSGKSEPDKRATEYLDNLDDVRGAGPIARKLFQEILRIAQRKFLLVLEELCDELKFFQLKEQIAPLLKKVENHTVNLNDVFNGDPSKIYKVYLSILWKKTYLSPEEFKTSVKKFNAKLSHAMQLSTVVLQKISELHEEYEILVLIAKRYGYEYARLLAPFSLGNELLEVCASSVEEIQVKEVLMKEHIHDFLLRGKGLDDEEMTKADGKISDARKSCASITSGNRTLMVETINQDDYEESIDDNVSGNGDKINDKKKGGHKKGCTAIPVRQRTPLQNYIIEHRADKASDGKPFCVSYNIARHTLKKNHEEAEQACRDFNGVCRRGGKCRRNCSHKLMDISKFSSRNEESDGDEESNGP